MSQPRLVFPAMQVGGSSYEAPKSAELRAIQPPVIAKSDPESPEASGALVFTEKSTTSVKNSAEAPVASSSATAIRPRRKVPRVLELLDQISRGHNEWWELLLGRYARTGWVGSLLVHGFVVAALGLLLITPERKEPPRIITLGTELDGPSAVGDTPNALQLADAPVISVESATAMLASGGSTGDIDHSLAAAFGPPAGRGSGLGRGEGSGAGDAIAGRVQAAGGKGGSLQISIAWNDRNDLDLHIVTPGGGRIYYAQPLAPDGGNLDVDMNVNGESKSPVENVTWGTRTPPDGKYRVQVHFFKRNSGGPSRSDFQVRVQIGSDVRVLSGKANSGTLTEVAQFEVQDGVGVALTTVLSEQDEKSAALSGADSKRIENRERAAGELLTEARATEDPKLRAGKLRRLLRQFEGTEAAAAAQEVLSEIPE